MVKILASLAVILGLQSLLFSCQSSQTTAAKKPENTSSLITDVPHQMITKARQITFEGPRAGEGYFSADGQYMIFQSERHEGNPFYQMYVMNLKTGKTQRVSPGQGKTTCGWIHPNMKKVMWSSTHLDPQSKKKATEEYEQRKQPVKPKYSWNYDEHYDIFESDLSGRNVRRLTKELGYDAEGSYSPDGQWIAFASNRAGYTEKLSPEDAERFKKDPSYMMDIYIMKSDGTQVRRLTHTKGYDGGPFFSPDGKKITWRRFSPNGATAEVYTMNIDGSDQKQITRLNSMSWAPFYHPSGDYIVFTSSILGYSNFELFIVDSEGRQNPVRVTFNEGFDGLPVFSPDGHKISWSHRNEKGESQIYLADWNDALAREMLNLPPKKLNPGLLASDIKVEDLKDLVNYLSSDQMAGRKAGSAEEKVYTQQLVELFKKWGLQGGGPKGEFLQSFTFTSGVSLGASNSLEILGNTKASLKVSQDFEPLSSSGQGVFNQAPVTFAGYGIKAPASETQPAYDSYQGLNVKGHWVLVLRDLPEDISPEYKHHLNLYSRLQHKITVARNEGALGLLVAPGPLNSVTEKWGVIKFEGGATGTSVAALRLSNQWAEALVKLAGKNLSDLQKQLNTGKGVEGFTIPSTYIKAQVDLKFEKSQAVNVIAKLPAGGKKAVLIGAHGDHLGRGELGSSLAKGNEKGQIHNGADDNASGVAGVMELAHYYAQLKKNQPGLIKKDLYFAIWSAEEIGILGSTHFTKAWNDNSKRPLNKYFSAYVNMDMIGRLKDRLYVQGVGSGDHWSQISEEVALKTGMPLSLQADPYLPTDSMAFYIAGIPTINFFTGVHSEYHSPRDQAHTIHYEGLARVLDVVKEYTNLLSDSHVDLVKYVKVSGDARARGESRSFRIYLGTIPDYSQEVIRGVRISGVSKESPAEKAGLKEKDIIVEFGGTKIENIYDYVYTLQTAKPDQVTGIRVKRGDEVVDLKIVPRLKE